MQVAMLTTVDNPYSPFDDWPAWFEWDTAAGYNSAGLLARISMVSHELSDKDFSLATEFAIDEIVRENVSGVHKKVVRDVEQSDEG